MSEDKLKLYSQFENAVLSGNEILVVDILISELGRLLLNNKLALVDIVRECGKEIPYDISDKQLAEIISIGLINKNKTFLEKLAKLMLSEKDKHYYSANGAIGSTEHLKETAKSGEIVKLVGEGIAVAVTKIGEAKINKDTKKQLKGVKELTERQKKRIEQAEIASKIIAQLTEQKINNINAEKQSLVANTNRELQIKKKRIVIGFVVLGVFGGLAYLGYKNIN